MSAMEWSRVPVGRDARRWHTVLIERLVLMVVDTVTSLGHLLDAVALLDPDIRLQVVYTQAPGVFGNGVAELLHRLGVIVLPWEQVSEFLEYSDARGGLMADQLLNTVHLAVTVAECPGASRNWLLDHWDEVFASC